MGRSAFQWAWRGVLAISLAVGPWPPAAWAAVAPAATAEASMADCHGDAPEPTPATTTQACEDGCCPDPACDPSHCLVLHASIASLPRMLRAEGPPPLSMPRWRADAPPDPPRRSLLRPPIA